MFFIQMSKVSGGNVVCAGIPSDALFGVPICNVNDVGAAEGSKFRTMRLGNNLSIVVMQHEELDGPRFEEKLHPLQHKSFFSGFNDANTDNSKMSSTNAAEATQWTRNATLSYGVGGSFSSSDVLSYAAGSAIAGGGARIQVGAVASGGGGDTNTPTGSASNRLGLSTDRAAGPSLGGSSVGGGGGGVGHHSSLLGIGGGASGLGGAGGSAGGGPSASGGASGDKNASAPGIINGVPLDPTIHEDPLVHWNHMGMFQNVSVDLKPSLKAHLTETIYGLTDPRNEVGGAPCPYATMYYHNALSEIAKETFYLGEEHEEFIARQRQRHPRQGAPNPSSPAPGNSGGGGLTSTNSSDWDFVMGNSTANAGGVITQQAPSGGSSSNNQRAAAGALTSTLSRVSGESADLARSPTAEEPHSHSTQSFAGQTPNRKDSSRDGGDLPPSTPTRAAPATVTYAPSAPPSISLSAPPAIEREAQDVENALETIKADIAYITVGSDMGYSTTTLLRVAAILSEVAVFLGYPNNEQHLRTVAAYIRKQMLEGNLAFLEQSRERLQKSGAASTAQLDGLLREATTLFGDQLAEESDAYANTGGSASGKRGPDGAQPRHPLYGTIMLGDRLVAETSPNFANDSLRLNSQSVASRGAELWASDKYIVQLISAAYYSFTTLVGDLVTPREWRIRKLEEGLAKFGINRNNVMKPKSRAFMVKYLQMLSAASPVAPSAPENVWASSPPHNPHQPTQHADDGDSSCPLNLGCGTSGQREASLASVSSAASSAHGCATAEEATSSPSISHYSTALRIGTNLSPVPKSDKASEEDASSIYTCYFDELLRLCDVNERIDEPEDSSDEEEEGAGGFLGDEGSVAFGRSRLSSVAVAQSNESSGEKDDFMGSGSGPESPPQHTLGAPRHTQGGHYHYGAFQTRGSTLMIGTSERDDRRPSTNARHSIYDQRSSNLSACGGGGNSTRKSGQLLVLDDTLREAMGSRNLRASMRLAASRSGDIVQLNASTNIGNSSAMANALAASLLQSPPLSLKKSLKLAKTSRKVIENIVPKCPPYHDACRFLPPVRSGEVHGFAPDLSSLDRPDVLYTAVIEGVLLRGYPDRTTILQLDFFNAPDDQMDGEEVGGSECPSGYSVAFLYAGLTDGDYDANDGSDDDNNGGAGEKAAELGRLQLLSDKALEGVYYMTYNAFRADLYRAMWLTSPTVDSYGVPGLIHFACVDRRQNNCVAANFDAAIRNATDTDVKLGNRMLHEIMAQSMSKAHELMAMGFSEGLWGHLGVQFFYCVGLMPSDSRLMVQQQAASANVSNLTSRAGSPEAINPYGGASSAGGAFGAARLMSGALGAGFGSIGGGGGVGGSHGGGGSKMLRRAARGNFNRSHYTQSVFVDAQTFNNAFNNSSFAGSVYSNNNVPSGRPSLALDVSQARGTLLFPERSKLPLAAVQNLLYRPYLIADKSEAAVLEFYGLFVGAMSPSEVCDSVELLLGKIFE